MNEFLRAFAVFIMWLILIFVLLYPDIESGRSGRKNETAYPKSQKYDLIMTKMPNVSSEPIGKQDI